MNQQKPSQLLSLTDEGYQFSYWGSIAFFREICWPSISEERGVSTKYPLKPSMAADKWSYWVAVNECNFNVNMSVKN